MRHGIPVTTPARTLLDLAATLAERDLQRTLDEAAVQRLVSVSSIDALSRAHPGHHGSAKLKHALQTHAPGTTVTRSELEERILALCKRHSQPTPRVNARVAGLEVDFLLSTTASWSRPTAGASTAPGPRSSATAAATQR